MEPAVKHWASPYILFDVCINERPDSLHMYSDSCNVKHSKNVQKLCLQAAFPMYMRCEYTWGSICTVSTTHAYLFEDGSFDANRLSNKLNSF
jgi:hypothetical protein